MNGAKAIMYASGLSASRYIEYGGVIRFFQRVRSPLLEIGCGHSILPTFWEKLGVYIIVEDLNLDALKWQKRKAESLTAVCCDGRFQPFRKQSIKAISCISTIEHLPNDGDIQLAREIGRVLKEDGLAVLTLPSSSFQRRYSTKDFFSDIPPLMKGILRKCLPTIFKIFDVDRDNSYFERHYNLKDVDERIIVPSSCELEDCQALSSKLLVKIVHGKILPQGVLTFLEYLLAQMFMIVSECTSNVDAMILKLRKGSS